MMSDGERTPTCITLLFLFFTFHLIFALGLYARTAAAARHFENYIDQASIGSPHRYWAII